MMNDEQIELNNIISVDMGECKILDEKEQKYLETNGLGPCVGVAIVIRTLDGNVHRLLGHIVMEEEDEYSFDELKECIKKIKEKTKNNINSIEISFTTTHSYRNFSFLTEDELKLLKIIRKEFNFSIRDIKFNYYENVQISPDGIITNNSERTDDNKHIMK